MKLVNHTLSYLSIAFFIVLGVWATIFYANFLDEIYDSIDDGLENTKLLILERVATDTTLIHKTALLESNYAIREINATDALQYRDVYMDSTIYTINEQDYEPVRVLKSAFQVHGKYYELLIVSSMVEEDDLIEDLLYSIIWLYVILLISIMIINNILLRRIWRPFYAILDRLRNFRVESPELPAFSVTRVTEFNMLQESITTLLHRTVATFQSQKQFIENASHELQTPLAISINKLELLAEKQQHAEANLAEISSVIESLQRLTRLNKTLLLLSKIENRQFPEQTSVDFNQLLDHLAIALSDLADYKSVILSVHHRGRLTKRINEDLASIMLSNLIKNGILHNVEGGRIEIEVTDQGVTIENTSTLGTLDKSKIFERFYKGSNQKHSTGLGLAIVKSICDLYGYKLEYRYNGKHVFSITMAAS
ncbi:sensor histidine kinase [Pseudochryseolinea flava]|uniref:histidine kinase n=1 Tax=Pseudochryseolinea flava TaxID=2059302 RepID=A0A364Y7G7_9BACT|nr:HAMP domain-containing sensor histidine kinase [Pseudochryseolinea flava]RAW02337.1 sensor histidine kinase [Pseudochryseolinea flava]